MITSKDFVKEYSYLGFILFLILLISTIYFYFNLPWLQSDIERSNVYVPDENIIKSILAIPVIQHLFMLFYCLIAFFLGFSFIQYVFRELKVRLFVAFFASFMLGYPMVIAINRVVTYFFPYRTAIVLIFILLFAFLYLLYRGKLFNEFKLLCEFSYLKKQIFPIFLFVLLLIVFLVHYIQRGAHPFTGDGIRWLLGPPLAHIFNSSSNHFPVFSYHYDEIMYSFPLIYITKHFIHPIYYFWVISSISISSMTFLLYMIFRYFKLGKLLSAVFTLYLLFGSQALTPVHQIIRFDAGNPLGFALSISRIFSCILPVLLFIYLHKSFNKYRVRWAEMSFLILFGIGIASFSQHILLYLFGFLISITLLNMRDKVDLKIDSSYIFLVLAIIFVIISPFYSLFSMDSQGVFIILSLSLGLFVFFWELRPFYFRNLKKYYIKPLVLGASALFSSLLFGNLITEMFRGPLSRIGSIAVVFIGYNPYSDLFYRFRVNIQQISLFLKQTTHPQAIHPISGGHYWTSYGLLYSLLTLVFFLVLYSDAFRNKQSVKQNQALLVYSFFSICFFSLSIFIYNYVHLGDVPRWYTTRFNEIPFYTLFILFMIIIGKYGELNRRYLYYGAVLFCLLWVVLPLTLNASINQFLMNLQYLLNNIV